MQLPEPYLSPNRWIAQIEKDTVIINPMYHGRGKYVVICWNPLGIKSDRFHSFNTPGDAQQWIKSLEQNIQHVETEHGKATVFICADGEYWQAIKDEGIPTYSKLYQVINMEHAVAMVKCTLESLTNKESIF
ncbi:hypothetical protein [Anabaena azotica]|uniref:hypothetical protein n=1 Tax=Anabaena azotica TaxID=197653 RepID=UPI0039A4DE62